MVHLVSSTNKQGSYFALARTWSQLKGSSLSAPTKSSFSEFREKVDYRFFEELYREQLVSVKNRKTFKGFFVYAVDGSDFDLPASDDVISKNFRGHTCSKLTEGHYPKMYVNHAFDVLNGLIKDFRFSAKQAEQQLGIEMITTLEPNSIAVYDRLYAGQKLFEAHVKAKRFFIVRARLKGNLAACVKEFLASSKADTEALWKSNGQPGPGAQVRLVKIKHPKTKVLDVFVTNLPIKKISRRDIEELYRKRWDVETSYRDLISTLKIDQWHSTKLNGILQEIYATFWLVNSVKSLLLRGSDEVRTRAKHCYNKSNFKFAVSLFVEHIDLLLTEKKRRDFILMFDFWRQRTSENREHYSRSYPRQVRSYGTGFSVASQVPKRAPRT
jgi:IS4 transposase